MLKKIIMLLFTAMITLSVISCSDDNSVTPKEEQKVKELGLKEVTVPEPLKQSTDPHAQMCVGMINLVNGFKAYSAYYQPPDNVNLPKQFNSNDSWTYEQLTMTMDFLKMKPVLVGKYTLPVQMENIIIQIGYLWKPNKN